jgi:hypothetical protein
MTRSEEEHKALVKMATRAHTDLDILSIPEAMTLATLSYTAQKLIILRRNGKY